jgi:acetyl-CoA C-acetyltransferase
MRSVAILGVKRLPVGEHWDATLRELGAQAVQGALAESNTQRPDALILGNAYGATFSSQTQAASLIADYAGLRGVETWTTEAGDASGGAALRAGYLAIASGAVETVAVVGAEKATDMVGAAHTRARNISLDADFEALHGATLTALAALVMRRYMYEYGVPLEAFEGFSINAHANGKRSEHAMYRNVLKAGAFAKAGMVADPVTLFDGAPDGDGAAAVVLTTAERAADLVAQPIYITGSAVASDTLTLQERADLLHLSAVEQSVKRALAQAGIAREAVHLFELHDAYTILTALTLEAAGFAAQGEGHRMANDTAIGLSGRLPISTFGGLKSRGNPCGATGVYQAVEATLQLRGQAEANQVKNAQVAMIQSVGGMGTSVFTHILQS